MIIIADQILLYRKIHVLLLFFFFCDVIFKFFIEHPEKNLWNRHCREDNVSCICQVVVDTLPSHGKQHNNYQQAQLFIIFTVRANTCMKFQIPLNLCWLHCYN